VDHPQDWPLFKVNDLYQEYLKEMDEKRRISASFATYTQQSGPIIEVRGPGDLSCRGGGGK
jgi:hypothetical protein